MDGKDEMQVGEHGLVSIKSAAGVLASEARERQAALPPAKVRDSDLASYVTAVFNENQDHKRSEGIEDDLLDNLRRRLGEYSPQKLKAIQEQGGSTIFAEITGVKCRNAEAWLSDVFSPDDEKAWSLAATPSPELPADATQQVQQAAEQFAVKKTQESLQAGQPVQPEQLEMLATKVQPILETFIKRKMEDTSNKRVRAMEAHMYDQLLEGQWDKVLEAFLFDLVTLKAGIMKGPIVRERKTRRWDISADGKSELIVESALLPVFERVSPFDFYPSPLAATAAGPGPCVEKLWLTRRSLESMKDMAGYDSATIERVLANLPAEAPENPDTSKDSERLSLERKAQVEDVSVGKDTVFGLEFHGFVPGEVLLKHGIKTDNDGKQLRGSKEYSVEVIQVGSDVIYASLNPDKLERHPYSSTSWSKVAGAFWGEGVPELLTPVQDICNASLRALVNNMGIASGPQMSINDIDRIPDNEDLTSIYPGKVWQFTNERNMTSDPVKFWAVPSNATELYAIYENFKKQADDDSGIPAYAYGNERTAGAGRTASGLSMLMTGASRGIKKVIRNVHRDVVRPSLLRLYDWNMQFVDDPSIKGDADVIAVGAVAILTREQSASRRMELLNQTNNPVDLKLVGLKNRAELLRQTFDSLEFDGEKHVLTDEQLDQVIEDERKATQAAQQTESAAVQAETQNKVEELKLKQQEATWDHEVDLQKLDLEAQKLDLEEQNSDIQNMSAELKPAEQKPVGVKSED